MGIFRFDRDGQIVGFEEKPRPARLAQIGSSVPAGATFLAEDPDKPFVASMASTCSRGPCCSTYSSATTSSTSDAR